jgi:hypothetical protein
MKNKQDRWIRKDGIFLGIDSLGTVFVCEEMTDNKGTRRGQTIGHFKQSDLPQGLLEMLKAPMEVN